jgi:hypothetical protein
MMGTQRLIAELNLLMDEAQREPEDLHELHFRVVNLINQLRAMGEPIPEDFLRFERELSEGVEQRRR